MAKLLGGLALLVPMSGAAFAAENASSAATQIYKSEDVIQQVAGQQKAAPEQAVPQSTESKAAATNGGEGGLLNSSGIGNWINDNRVKVSGHIEQGYTWNPDRPHDRLNFGRLFDDRSNDYRLNQALITFERALEAKPCCTDWGFKAQFMYGSDARYVHSLGFMDNITDDTVQPDIVELFWTYHMPVLTEGGVDLKVGQFVTLMGAEVIYAPADYTYSHSYIFNFGIPFKHTGIMTTTHVNKQLDVMAGLVAGINTGSFDDNNDAWA
ncbi:MAG: outer membrane beta-barrel protein, partial [Planctomycetes bacterium]|nr:outer membrane beta-barrel protein [Planctomycetota bacterium]